MSEVSNLIKSSFLHCKFTDHISYPKIIYFKKRIRKQATPQQLTLFKNVIMTFLLCDFQFFCLFTKKCKVSAN